MEITTFTVAERRAAYTVLHQLGVDHTRVTYLSGGRNYRLTDVHGNVLRDLLA